MDTASAATSTSAIAPGKSHFVILDGLRGVASLTVVVFHLFEAFTGGDPQRQIINHGYLAVDFFFMLSGFVIAYAYDDRWSRMTQWDFYKRRLIRLQPMVVLGTLIGAALFYPGRGALFPQIAATPVWKLLFVAVVGCTLLPLPQRFDIRGWQEMHPLDGPAWSLFYEYVANILYAVWLRRVSKVVLGVMAVLAAAFLFHFTVLGAEGDIRGGWSLDRSGVHAGLARLLYPFLAGLLLCRAGARIPMRHGFAAASLLLLATLAAPRFGGASHLWVNGLYETLCVVLVFPLVVAIGAGEKRVEGFSIHVARFFGDLSYPLYITHYPLIYLYTAWVMTKHVTGPRGLLPGVLTLGLAVVIAYCSLRFYDEPVRRWLSRRFLSRQA